MNLRRPASRTYVVTGTASGIGLATRTLLESDGHRVVGVDLRGAEIELDLGDRAERAGLVQKASSRIGGELDGVVACAGVTSAAAVAVNFFGAVSTLASLAPLLARSAAGRAVAVASFASIRADADAEVIEACLADDEERATSLLSGKPPGVAYPSSKAALCRWIRREAVSPDWASRGLPLNGVAPGIVKTPMTQQLLGDAQSSAALRARVPMPLSGPAAPEQIAPLLAWLVGESNTHVTGQVIFIDGGADAVVRGDAVW